LPPLSWREYRPRGADPPPEEKTGLKVGEKAPDFKLKDQDGEERLLTALLKEGNVALVFYRSAGW
jgi:cytochrome oxidase Cu insertion factor (SCO1/SenC/PrrC family)